MAEAGNISVHRCRFVDFTPAAITAIAFPPLPLPTIRQNARPSSSERHHRFGTLAVGKANGNIDLYQWSGAEHQIQSSQGWVVSKILAGPAGTKIDSLAFSIRYPHLLQGNIAPDISNLRLFSTGGSNKLLEWNVEDGTVQRTLDSQGGALWSIAANPASTLLALGCEDGCIRLVSVADSALDHYRRFDRLKCRLLSLAWGPPILRQSNKRTVGIATDEGNSDDNEQREEDEWEDSWLVSGNSDSSLRKWDFKTGRALSKMTVDRTRNDSTLVWTVAVLGDGIIVSGDSLGTVKFWDSLTCTQLQTFQAHGADVLCLVIGPEGETVFSSGVDQKTTLFSKIKSPSLKESNADMSLLLRPSSSRWVQSTFRRMHAHDVRSLAIWPPYRPLPDRLQRPFGAGISPILASAGLDMTVVLTPCAPPSIANSPVTNPLATSAVCVFEDAYYHRLAYTSGLYPVICCARQARLLMCVRDRGVTLWRILARPPTTQFDPMADDDLTNLTSADAEEQGDGYEKLFDLDISCHTNLLKGSISDDGTWMAVSDRYEVKLFALDTVQGRTVKPRKIKHFSSLLSTYLQQDEGGASAIGFSPDSAKLVLGMYSSASVLIIDLAAYGGSEVVNGGHDWQPRVLRHFENHRSLRKGAARHDRVLRRLPKSSEPAGNVVGGSSATGVEISALTFSPDGQWLATTDDCCRTHVFNLDAIQHHCIVPTMAQRVHGFAFDPFSPSLLILAFANNSLQVYNVERKEYPSWSRDIDSNYPRRYRQLTESILGISFRQGAGPEERYAVLWSSTWLCKVKLEEGSYAGVGRKKRRRDGEGGEGNEENVLDDENVAPMSEADGAASMAVDSALENSGGEVNGNAREDRGGGGGLGFKIITRYRPILFVDFLASDEMVVVERPLLDVLSTLPPAYFKPKYGSG